MSDEKIISQFIPEETLPGRGEAVKLAGHHEVLGTSVFPPYPESMDSILFGMGCFWGVERQFWSLPGIYTTSVGYAGGQTPNPSYEEVCSGLTGHVEVVQVVYDTRIKAFQDLLNIFWEYHDPTQGMRQGNDHGSQYRSAIYCDTPEQQVVAAESKINYQLCLNGSNFSEITTEILLEQTYYFAEEYHQQYLNKNPNGYCAMRGTGVSYDAGRANP